jgi:hypothetical protein
MCGRQCPKKLWQTVYDPQPAEEPFPGTVKGMGIEVGVKARLLWPGGVLIDTKYDDYAEAVRRTNALIADPTVPAIFEAALVHDGVLIRADALERIPDGRWRLNEVKSSTRINDEHLEDLALQTYVIVGSAASSRLAHFLRASGLRRLDRYALHREQRPLCRILRHRVRGALLHLHQLVSDAGKPRLGPMSSAVLRRVPNRVRRRLFAGGGSLERTRL